MATTVVQFPPAYFVRAPGRYFDEFGTATAAAASTGTTVVSYRVPEAHWGLLLGVSFEGGQLTNWWYGTWHLLIAGVAHSFLTNVQGMITRITEPIPVWTVLKPNQLVQLVVDNTNPTYAFIYAGRLMGYVQDRKILLQDEIDDMGVQT